MNGLPREGVAGLQEPGMRKTLRFDPHKKFPFKAKFVVAGHMRPAGTPLPRPSLPEHRKDVCAGECRYIPNCFAESSTRSFGKKMIEERNGAANAAKYSVAAVPGKMRVDRHFRVQSLMDGANRLFEYRGDRPGVVRRDRTLDVDISQVERRMTQADSERTCDGVRIRSLIASNAWTDER